jgi:hypothetical protein
MKKESLICFRAGKDLRESLGRVAKEDQRSLSSTIEIALISYLKERKAPYGVEREKRQYPRKTISFPAMINNPAPGQIEAGAITEISLCGVKVLIPKNSSHEIIMDQQGARFEIVFMLPDVNMPIKLTCEPKRVVDSPDSLHIGASFVDANFQSYRALQTYLM